MKHSRRSTPFSLFSFQDIITGLCGIMIFFVLIMILDLVMKREPTAVQSENQNIEIDDWTDELKMEIAALKNEL